MTLSTAVIREKCKGWREWGGKGGEVSIYETASSISSLAPTPNFRDCRVIEQVPETKTWNTLLPPCPSSPHSSHLIYGWGKERKTCWEERRKVERRMNEEMIPNFHRGPLKGREEEGLLSLPKKPYFTPPPPYRHCSTYSTTPTLHASLAAEISLKFMEGKSFSCPRGREKMGREKERKQGNGKEKEKKVSNRL